VGARRAWAWCFVSAGGFEGGWGVHTMVETNGVVARIIRVSHIKHANTIIEHLKKWAFLTTEDISWWDSRALSQIGHKSNKFYSRTSISKEFCLSCVGVVAWLWSISLLGKLNTARYTCSSVVYARQIHVDKFNLVWDPGHPITCTVLWRTSFVGSS